MNIYVLPTRHYTPSDNRYVNEEEIVPNTDNLWYLQFYIFYNCILVIDTIVQNNDNEISLHFNLLRLSFINHIV